MCRIFTAPGKPQPPARSDTCRPCRVPALPGSPAGTPSCTLVPAGRHGGGSAITHPASTNEMPLLFFFHFFFPSFWSSKVWKKNYAFPPLALNYKFSF